MAHPFEIALFKAFNAGFLGLDEGGELLDRLLSPFGGFEPIVDVLSDRPIKLNQFLVGVSHDAILNRFDQRQDFGELGLEAIGHGDVAFGIVQKGESMIWNYHQRLMWEPKAFPTLN